MKLKEIGNQLILAANQTGVKIQKNSPQILMAVGVVTFVGTVVLAAKATLEAEKILDDHRGMMDEVDQALALAEEKPEVYDYNEENAKRDKVRVYSKTAIAFTKQYAPAVLLGGVTLVCFFSSNRILQKRYIGAVAAYNAVSKAFDEYRKRVVEELGEDKDYHFRYGTDLVKETRTIEENGKKRKVTEETQVIDPEKAGEDPYVRVFDASNPNWDSHPAYNMAFLRAKNELFQNMLNARGHLFLNEVLDELGYEHTPEGSVTGWIKSSNNPDSFVDIGLFDQYKAEVRQYCKDPRSIVLTFNVDGVIYDQI